MIPAASARQVGSELIAGAALGVYAATIALVPGLADQGAVVRATPCDSDFLAPAPHAHRVARLVFRMRAADSAASRSHSGDSGPHIAIAIAGVGIVYRLAASWGMAIPARCADVLAHRAVGDLCVRASRWPRFIPEARSPRPASRAWLLFGISIYVFLYVRDGPGRLTTRASLARHPLAVLGGRAFRLVCLRRFLLSVLAAGRL